MACIKACEDAAVPYALNKHRPQRAQAMLQGVAQNPVDAGCGTSSTPAQTSPGSSGHISANRRCRICSHNQVLEVDWCLRDELSQSTLQEAAYIRCVLLANIGRCMADALVLGERRVDKSTRKQERPDAMLFYGQA